MIRLNLGSGPNMFPGWINVDRVDQSSYINILAGNPPDAMEGWPDAQRQLAAHCKTGKVSCQVHDLREPLPMPDNFADAIYIGQAVEHLNRGYELPKILKECLRVLKPGAPIRITTPDLQLLLDCALAGTLSQFAPEQPEFFVNALPEDQLCYLMFGAMGPDSTNERYEGHHHLFTERSLYLALKEAGFANIFRFQVSEREEFADAVDCGMSHSVGMEAVKP